MNQSIEPEVGLGQTATPLPGNQNEVALLQEAFGPRYRRLGPRKVVLNLTFWAHFLAGKMRLAYHVQRDAFLLPKPGAEGMDRVELDELFKFTIHGLQQAANLEPNKFPIHEIRLPRVRMLIEEMKLAAAVNTPGEKEALLQFLVEALEFRKGSNLTVAELHHRYTDSCRTKALPRYPESVFQRLLPAVIRELFALARCNNLRRPGPEGSVHWHRGFRRLAFKTAGTAGTIGTPEMSL